MVFCLHPTSLDTLGLTNTINNLCKNLYKIHRLRIDFKAAGMDSLNLNFDVKIAIYRLVQEGLNNIVKHSEATQALVRLVYSYPNIILRIEDNGKGFDVDQLTKTVTKKGCMGIWSMKERVALLNGEMTIRSVEQIGTNIHIQIPYYEK